MIQPSRCYVVAEIGLNHNGDIARAVELVKAAKAAGCDAVKFQKRTVEVVYTPEELARLRDNPFGRTNGDLKYGLEFGRHQYDLIDDYCRRIGIDWFASPWDEASVDFLQKYSTGTMPYFKIASACLTDAGLLRHAAATGRPLLLSTGMSDLRMIQRAVEIVEGAGGKVACIYHCVSTYPTEPKEINLAGITTLARVFTGYNIGWSGHDVAPATGVMAAVLGAVSVERHMTFSRADWGSDQAASLEVRGMEKMVSDIRLWEQAQGTGRVCILDSERPLIAKLRRKDTLFEDIE